jgi:hypothetical protein
MNASNETIVLTRRAALVAASLLGLGATIRDVSALSQTGDAIPAVIPGVALATLCSGESTVLAGRILTMMRVTLYPGLEAIAREMGGPTALFVESGSLEIELLTGTAAVTRALVDGMWAGHRVMVAGDSTRLAAGDHLFHDDAGHTLRNAGDEPLVLLVSMVHDADLADRAWLSSA